MNFEGCHLGEQLRTARLESTELRRKLHELKMEFIQLRQAFEINIRTQKHQETRLSLLTHENQEIRGFAEECLRNVTKMQGMLKDAENQKNFWKNRTIQDLKDLERKRNEIEILEKSIQKNHTDVSKNVQDEMEIRLTELSKLYDEAKEKVRRLEDETMEATKQREFFETRTRELANLLTTLEHFDLDAKTLCRLTATAIENLTEVGLSFSETVKKLRQFTWQVDNRKSATEVDTLRSQNLILREIVKSLKRKAQYRSENQTSEVECSQQTDEKPEKIIQQSSDPCNIKADINDVRNSNDRFLLERESSLQEKNDLVINGISRETFLRNDETDIKDITEHNKPLPTEYNRENTDIVSNLNGKVLCIESRTNGIFFEEYVIRFSNNRQMKIKYSPEVCTKVVHLKLELLDSEDKYRESSPDKVVILLKNLYVPIKNGHTNINCSTETILTQKCNNNTQTSMEDMHDFPKLNIGRTISTMLNSEKRAIERNLSSLERTVADLKSNTLHHARSMIGKKSKYSRNDQFFKCIERLTGN